MQTLDVDYLVDAICLLGYSPNNEDTKKIIRSIIENYKDIKNDKSGMGSDPVVQFFVSLLDELLTSGIDLTNKSELKTILTKLELTGHKLNSEREFKNACDLLLDPGTPTPARILQLQHKLRNWIVTSMVNKHLRQMFGKSSRVSNTSDLMEQDVLLDEILENARDMVSAYEGTAIAMDATIEHIDFSDISSIRRAIITEEQNSAVGAFKVGLQGFGRLFGAGKGPARGEFCGIGASPHHYKSGILMDLLRWMVMYNDPRKYASLGKIPTIVFITLENEAYKNLQQWFYSMYCNLYQEEPVNMTFDQITEFVFNSFQKTGWNVQVYRKDGDLFGFEEFKALINDLKAKGCEVVATIIDYLTLMHIPETQDRPDKAIQKLGYKLKNMAHQDRMLIFTTIQLNGAADILNDSGTTYVVKRYGGSHFADCKSLLKEFDFFAFQFIEKPMNGCSYLTWMWKKHRYCNPPPAEDKFCAYRFTPLGILDDINRPDQSVTDIYADTTSSDGTTQTDQATGSLF